MVHSLPATKASTVRAKLTDYVPIIATPVRRSTLSFSVSGVGIFSRALGINCFNAKRIAEFFYDALTL